MSAANKDFTPMEARGTVIYLGRSGGFDVRHCPEPESLAAFIVASCNAAAIAPPVAASVDTQAFQGIVGMIQSEATSHTDNDESYVLLVSHIDAWGAQQRESGRQEVIGMQSEFLKKLHAATERAEKAEARVKDLENLLVVLQTYEIPCSAMELIDEALKA